MALNFITVFFMLRSRLWICPFLLALPLGARAEDAPAPTFWRENTFASPTLPGTAATPAPVSRAQFFNAVSGQVSFVGALKSWRETLRGSGPKARRDLWKNSLAGGQMALSLGQVSAPGLAGFGANAGTVVSWRGASGATLEAGTTARPLQLDEAMQRFDKVTTGDDKTPLAPLDRASLTWLRTKPLTGKEGEVEAVLLRAARDGKAGEGEKWTSGTFGSVNARLAMPGKWMVRGAWTSAQMDVGEAASSWNTSASGPLSHPWGEANVAFNWRATDAGFATFAGQNLAGERAGDAQITQPIKTALVSGQLSAAASTQERPSLEGAQSGTEVERDAARAGADLKVQLLPGIALKATGNLANTQIERATDDEITSREELVGAGGDVGVELKMSKSLSLEAGAGVTSGTRVVESVVAGQNLESRATLKLRHRTGDGSWAASLQARDRSSTSTNTNPDADTVAPWSRVANVGLEGERRLIGDFRVRANANWMIDRQAQNGDTTGVARLVGAQLLFSKAARLDVRYRDGAALPSDLSQDPLGALFSSPSFAGGNREIATRFNIGAAASGKGFGMALEWARQGVTNAPTDSWKIGLTYR